MRRFSTRQQLANFLDHNGGVFGALKAGIAFTDMPDADPELTDSWAAAEEAYQEFRTSVADITELLPKPEAFS